MLLLLLCLSVCCCRCCCCCCCVCESVCVCVCSVCVCVCSVCVCSVCSALRACGAYNPTELKRLQHGQKITNMLENQVQQHMVFKKESCIFFGLFQGKFFCLFQGFGILLSAAGYMHIYVQCLFQGKSLFQGKNLFQGKAFSKA